MLCASVLWLGSRSARPPDPSGTEPLAPRALPAAPEPVGPAGPREERLTVGRPPEGAAPRLKPPCVGLGGHPHVWTEGWAALDPAGAGGARAVWLRQEGVRAALGRLHAWTGVSPAEVGRAAAFVDPWVAVALADQGTWAVDAALADRLSRRFPDHPATGLVVASVAAAEGSERLFEALARVPDPALARLAMPRVCVRGPLEAWEVAAIERAVAGAEHARPDLLEALAESAFAAGDPVAFDAAVDRLARAGAPDWTLERPRAEQVAAGRRAAGTWREALIAGVLACGPADGPTRVTYRGGAWAAEVAPSVPWTCALERASRGPAPLAGTRLRVEVVTW